MIWDILAIIGLLVAVSQYKSVGEWIKNTRKIGKTGINIQFRKKTIKSLIFNGKTDAALFFHDDQDYHKFTKHFIEKDNGDDLIVNTATLAEWHAIVKAKGLQKHSAERVHLIYNYDKETNDANGFFVLNNKSELNSYDKIFCNRGDVRQINVLTELPNTIDVGCDVLGGRLYELGINITEKNKNGRVCFVYSHKRNNKRLFFVHVLSVKNLLLERLKEDIMKNCIKYELKND